MSRLRCLVAAVLVVACVGTLVMAASAHERAETARLRAADAARSAQATHGERLLAAAAAARVGELEARYELLRRSVQASRVRLLAAVERASARATPVASARRRGATP